MKFFRRIIKIILLILVIFFEVLLILTVDYTIFDNNQINVVRQVVQIKGLPPEFDGFTILQITDLHGKRFGVSQQYLIGIINSLDYDAIAFTGDMLSYRNNDLQPFLEVLHGIKKRPPMFFISGNAGPFDLSYDIKGVKRIYSIDMATGQFLDPSIVLQRAGCTLLDQPKSIERAGARLWFAADFSPSQSIFITRQSEQALLTEKDPQQVRDLKVRIEYQKTLQKIYASFRPSDTLIGIFHYPLTYQMLANPQDLPPYDLIIAGHYHGGQIRLPYLGAVYIPDDSLPWHGLFPPQSLVSGLVQGNGIQQYISRGLGASSRIPFMQFRLFDTPEINLITLKRSQ